MSFNTTKFLEVFWEERIWLPPNLTWQDVEPRNGMYTKFSDLCYPIPLALLLVILRRFCELRVFKPIGLSLGIKNSKHTKPATNEVLEREFNLFKKDKTYQINVVKLAQELEMRERQIEYWFKRRKLYGRPTTLDKFMETGWRWLYYSGTFIYGVCCLWDKPWLWNIRHCWYNYPHHEVSREVWWYYMVELAFYWSLFFSQFVDVKRKDFVEMFVHHITTISLLCFSWTCNLTRCGTLVLVLHDFSDIFLEFAKLLNYSKFRVSCDIVFGTFTVCWIFTRLGMFPVWILYSTTVEAPQIGVMFPAYYIFNGLLSVLLVLHAIWTYFILKIAYKALFTNQKAEERKDSRSDSGEETCSTTDEEAKTTNNVELNHCNAAVKQNGAFEKNGILANGVSTSGACNGEIKYD